MDEMNEKNNYFLFFICGLIIGSLVAITTINILVSYRIEQYHKEILYLNSVIEDKEARLKKLEDTLHKRKFVIKKVSIDFEFEDENLFDDIVLIALEKEVKQKYNKFIGKEVEKTDVEILSEVIDNRIFKIGDIEYQLKVNKIMLTQELKIWIELNILNKIS